MTTGKSDAKTPFSDLGIKLFVLAATVLFLYIAYPLIFPLAMGAVLAVLVHPMYRKLEKKMPVFAASWLLTLGVTLLFLIPFTLLIFFIAKTGFQQVQAWRDLPRSGGGLMESLMGMPAVHDFIERSSRWFPIERQDLLDSIGDLVRTTGLKLADIMAGVMTKLPATFMAMAVIVVSIYFFLVEGKRLVELAKRGSVFSPAQTDHLLKWTGGVCRSVILASLVSGLAQASVEVLFLLILSIPNVALIAGLVFVASFVPLVGSAPVTLIVALQVLLSGRAEAGVALLFAALVIIILDNLIRPLFLKGSANLHPLLGFVAAFGGLQTIGMLGVFLGPIVAAVFVATWQILLVDKTVPASSKAQK